MTDPLSPSDLWLQITAMPRPSRVVDFPRTGADGKPVGELRIRVLTQEEQILCAADAERYTKKAIRDLPKGDEAKRGYEDVFNNSAAVEVIFRACRQRDDADKPFFPTCDAIRKTLTPDEVGVLMMNYYTTQAEVGPIVARMSKEEVEAWIVRLGEGGSRFPLDLLSLEMLKDLAFTLASRIHSSATDTSSPGLPQSEESTPSSPST